MKKFVVKINTHNKFFLYKNKLIRSPLEMIVTEDEIQNIRSKIKYEDITDYTIEEFENHKKKEKKQEIITLADNTKYDEKEPVIEKIENLSSLDKLLIEE